MFKIEDETIAYMAFGVGTGLIGVHFDSLSLGFGLTCIAVGVIYMLK